MKKLIEVLRKKYPQLKFTLDSYCSYPLWNYEANFILIDGFIDGAPYRDNNISGPECLNSYCKKALGKILYNIVSLAKKER